MRRIRLILNRDRDPVRTEGERVLETEHRLHSVAPQVLEFILYSSIFVLAALPAIRVLWKF